MEQKIVRLEEKSAGIPSKEIKRARYLKEYADSVSALHPVPPTRPRRTGDLGI